MNKKIKSIEEIKKVPASSSKNGINTSGFQNRCKQNEILKNKFQNSKRGTKNGINPLGFYNNHCKSEEQPKGWIPILAAQAAKGGLTVLISILIIFTIVKAGSLTPSASPAATSYTLSDIYNRLNTNATATVGNHIFSPSAAPAGTLYTLTEIYNKIPTINSTKVLSGTSYLGVDGTMASNGVFGLTCGVSNQSVTAGYYSGGTLLGDADLVAGNIKSGAFDIFGVSGTLLTNPLYGDNNPTQVLNTAANQGTYDPNTCSTTYNTLYLSVGTVKSGIAFGNGLFGEYPSATYILPDDTGATDAAVGNILSGLEAWTKAGSLLTGTMADKEGDNGSTAQSAATGVNYFTAPTGFYDGDDRVSATDAQIAALDANIATANIASNVDIFGVSGTLLKNLYNGSAGALVADFAFYTQAKGGVDDYNNTGTMPSGSYSSSWTACVASDYCGTNDSNADKKDNSANLVWSKWLGGGTAYTWFWANNCYEPGTTENPGTCVNNGDDACQCVKKTSSLVGCEALGGGWRLPYQKELMQAYIDGSWGNLSSAGNHYWSATTTSTYTNYAWYTSLDDGGTNGKTKTSTIRVRCVR